MKKTKRGIHRQITSETGILRSNGRLYNTVKVTAQYLLNAKSVIGGKSKTEENQESTLLKKARIKGIHYLWGIGEAKMVQELSCVGVVAFENEEIIHDIIQTSLAYVRDI